MTQKFLTPEDYQSFLGLVKQSAISFAPETILLITLIVAILADLIFKKSKNVAGHIGLFGFAAALIALFVPYQSQTSFFEMTTIDPFGQFFKAFSIIASFAIIVFSFFSDELYKSHKRLGEYFTLIIGMTFGMTLLAGASNLIMIYLAIETMSLCSYVLAGFTKDIKRSSEASLKYVLYGAASSGVMIYGISIIYGLTGALNLDSINIYLASNPVELTPLYVSIIMILVGFGYKISAAPFHFWAPDVYEGAPISITAYLSVASKAAGFAVLIRFIKSSFLAPFATETGALWNLIPGIDWRFILAILAVLSMTIGNFTALKQSNIKRMLAYSSIAHAGYMLMALAAVSDNSISSIMLYFLSYFIMNIGAFFVAMKIADKTGIENIDEYNGLGYRNPLMAVCFTIFLISLTGLPPTFGFIGKLYVFTAVINAKMYWLAVIGVLNSVVSLVYYVGVIRNMFLRRADGDTIEMPATKAEKIFVLAFAIPTILLGLYFTPALEWTKNSIFMLTK